MDVIISRVMENEHVKEAVENGSQMITPEKVKETATKEEKLNKKFTKTPGWFGKQINKVRLLFWLIKDYSKRKYRKVPWTTIAMVTTAIIYFLNPADLIPDVLPVVGYVDDAAVIGFVFATVENDLRKYAEWKGLDLSLFWD